MSLADWHRELKMVDSVGAVKSAEHGMIALKYLHLNLNRPRVDLIFPLVGFGE